MIARSKGTSTGTPTTPSSTKRPRRRYTAALVLVLLAWTPHLIAARPVPEPTGPAEVFEGPVPRARCGPGSLPETDLQGRVSRADRLSGRSQQGYRCNLELVGQYQGFGTTWVSQSHASCSYQAQAFPSSLLGEPGVHVIDVRDPAHPNLATRLMSPAFQGPWESMKVNERRGLIAATFGGALSGTGFFDVYDLSEDCTKPELLASVTGDDLGIGTSLIAHEGGWSPDGMTYWSTGGQPGLVTAMDVTDPRNPQVVFSDVIAPNNHGLDVSEDGNLLYLASIDPTGMRIFDVSEIQARQPSPQVRELGSIFWPDGDNGMQPTAVSWNGRPHVVFVDELGGQAARIIDVGDPTVPFVVAKLKLEIHMDAAAGARAEDLGATGLDNGLFGYEGHYCAVDRDVDPTMVACGYFQSGIRVFDVRVPHRPREIAYFNPPAQVGRAGQLPGSEHAQGLVVGGGPADLNDMTTDWCSSPPKFVGTNQLWVHCQDNGFMVLQFTNGVRIPQQHG